MVENANKWTSSLKSVVILAQYSYTKTAQRICKYSDIQYISLTLDKMLNSLVYSTLLYVNIYGSYKLLKTVRFFGPPCTHTGTEGERGVGGYWNMYLGTRNLENRCQKYRENWSLQTTMIGALVIMFRFFVRILGFERYWYWGIGYWPILAGIGWYWYRPNTFFSNRAQY